jgi:hypothetical protein
LEGDPFVGSGGREYLFGFAWADQAGRPSHDCRWAMTAEEEKRAVRMVRRFRVRRFSYDALVGISDDAPRGMEFLYSLNRLNVATSRAQAVIVVDSPRLLEPECRNPQQMQLANAFCRYAEIAQVVEMPSYTRGSGSPL